MNKYFFIIIYKFLNLMEYRRLGETGLKISAIGYGNWMNANTPESLENNTKIV